MNHALRDKVLSILDRCHDLTIATVRPDGAPQATVVSFVHDGMQIYFGCGVHAQKALNIARDPRVAITVTPPYADWQHIEGVSLSGPAREVTDAQEKTHIAELMITRFPQLGLIPVTEPGDMKLFCVQPTMISVLDYTKGFGHTDRIAMLADGGIDRQAGLGPEQASAA